MVLRIDIDHWFVMAAILNPIWPPKYKTPPIWTKFGFQVDYDVANWYQSLVCYGGHFVNGLWFQWTLISRSCLKWRILIWGSFGDFCVCIETQSSLVMAPKRSLWDILFLLCFLLLLLLLHHPDCCRVMYCYSTFLFHYYYYFYYYYCYSSTYVCPLYFSEMPWSNFMKPCRNIICHAKLCL
jgi:hypothetical protein